MKCVNGLKQFGGGKKLVLKKSIFGLKIKEIQTTKTGQCK